MLEPWIIEEILKREQEQRERERQQQIELPIERTGDPGVQQAPSEERGVTIIDI